MPALPKNLAAFSPPPFPRRRVLHVITHLSLGGAERIALDLMRGLQGDFDAAVYAVRGIATDAVGVAMQQELNDAHLPIFTGTRLPIKLGGLPAAGWHAAKAVEAFQPDLVHLHTEIPEASIATMLTLRPALRRVALVRTIHNSEYWRHWPRLGRWSDRRLAHARIAGVSEAAVDAFARLRTASKAAPPPDTPVVIFNGLAFHHAPRPLDRVPGECIRLLYAGRFEFQKGTDLLPSVLAQTRPPAGHRCELTLHGVGADESKLRALAATPPPGWTVDVQAPVADLAGRMSEFDFVLMPSRFEGLSLVAIEAMLLSVPLVATDAPGLREQLPADYPWRARAGDADDFARALQTALNAPASGQAAVAAAQELARRRFDPHAMLAGYRKIYREALGTAASRI